MDTELLQQDSFVDKTYRDVATIEELQQWMRGPFHRTLFTSGTYAGGARAVPGTIFGADYIIGGAPQRSGGRCVACSTVS